MRSGKRPLVVGAIAASATAAAAFAIAAGSASGIDTPQTMDLKVGRGHDTAVDVGKHGDSIGDGFITTGARLTDTSGRVAGSADVLGTILSRGEDAVQISLRLPAGRVEVRGIQPTSGSPTDLAVVGGTGAYSNVRGELRLIPRKQTLELHLEP
ncbi:MAG: hypothetical protein ACJ77Z_04185 [Thermoleophilaceae bacterium]|jgi:hypothetical protein